MSCSGKILFVMTVFSILLFSVFIVLFTARLPIEEEYLSNIFGGIINDTGSSLKMCEKFKIFGIVTKLSKWQEGQNTHHLEVLRWSKSLFLHNCLVPRFATCVNLFICIMMKCNHWSIYTQIVITLFIWKSSMIFCAICDKKK